MELRHLRYFVAVARELNFTRASEKLNIAQPPLSRQIKDLEDELGAPLFIRRRSGLVLTEQGHELLSYASQILSLVDTGVQAITDKNKGLNGQLRIAVCEFLPQAGLGGILSIFAAEHPGVSFDVLFCDSKQALDLVRSGERDFALVLGDAPADLAVAMLYRDSCVAACRAEAFLEGTGTTVTTSSLVGHSLLLPSDDMLSGEIIERLPLSPAHPALRVAASAGSPQFLLRLASDGMGIAILPQSLIPQKHIGLAIHEISSPAVNVQYYMAYERAGQSTLKLAFAQFIQKQRGNLL